MELIKVRQVAIFRPKTQDDLTQLSPEMAEVIHSEAFKAVVVNLQYLPLLNTPQISTLVIAYTRIQRRQARFILCQCQPMVNEILHIAQLDTIFEIVPSEQEALKTGIALLT